MLKNKKKIKFSIYEFLKTRPLSWSALSSFEYDPEQWYRRYYLGIESEKSAEMEFGSMIGKRLESDPTFLPQIPRQSKMEHKFVTELDFSEWDGNELVKEKKIPIIGYADSFCGKTYLFLEEYKTGKKSWDQKRADKHGQVEFYLLMNLFINRIQPQDVKCRITWMPTWKDEKGVIRFLEPIEKRIKTFETKRTMRQIMIFADRIRENVEAMERYVNNHP